MPERVDQGGVRLAGGTNAEADGVGEDDAAGVGEVVGEVGWAVVAGPVGSGVVARLVASVRARGGEGSTRT